jgi:hypothetical protein
MSNNKKIKQMFITVSKWQIDVPNCSIAVYNNINGEYLITRYYIDKYEIKSDDEFKFYTTYRLGPLKISEDINGLEWKECDYVITCNIVTHVYIDSRYDGNSYRGHIIGDYNTNHFSTYKNVLARLKSTGSKLIK